MLAAACLAGAAPKKPKLVLAIVVDQFRYDYLTRFRSEYKGGLARLLSKGAVFTNASYIHVPAITAVGHSTFLTGATPSISGIVANDWYDRDEGVHVTSVSDAKTQLLGGSGTGLFAQPAAGEHGRRRVEDGRRRQAAGHRRVVEGPGGDSALGAHGGRRVLVRCEDRQLREQHLLLQGTAGVGARSSTRRARRTNTAA